MRGCACTSKIFRFSTSSGLRGGGGTCVVTQFAPVHTQAHHADRLAFFALASFVDGYGALLLACFVDAHVHFVKTHAHPRTRNPTGSLSDALSVEVLDEQRWAACPCCRPVAFSGGGGRDADDCCTPCPAATDVLRRMDFACASAFHHGTRAIRTHLDGSLLPCLAM